ncbi:MAG: hypothetical protein HPY85_13330 [Anaerolineae bacterium]|nr:hypothetical protein [Anaerolineae bacterium]
MNKYSPLEKYLYYLKRYDTVINLPFAEIEEIIGKPLPPSAHKHPAWWANDSTGSHTHARAWMRAGWKVDHIDLANEYVEFSVTE